MDDSRRRSLKVVRVLCDGCERASAAFYCSECKECACSTCAEQLHVRGRRGSKRGAARTCKGRHMKDLGKAAGVLALCKACRTRPAYRFSSGEVYPICKECRQSFSSKDAKAKPANDVVKRAIAEELGRSKASSSKASSSKASSSKASSSKASGGKHRHKRGIASTSEDDSTGDDATNLGFSRESSAG